MVNLNIADVTVGSGTLSGDGAFDVFMQAAMVHLRQEYSDGRINGDKYADAYIAIMNNVLNTAAQFAVNKANLFLQNELTEEQKELIRAQAAQVRRETVSMDNRDALTDAQTGQVKAETGAVNSKIDLTVAQKDQVIRETTSMDVRDQLTTAQKDQVIGETNSIQYKDLLVQEQTKQVNAETQAITSKVLLTEAQTKHVEKETENLTYQGDLIQAQTLQTQAETTSIGVRDGLTKAQTNKVSKEIDAIDSQILVNTSTIEVNNANKELIKQKRFTEEAQVSNTYDQPTKQVEGLIGKQKEVYTAQIKGFKDDALQKAAKLFVDTWSVRKSTDTDGTLVDGRNKLEDVNIGKAITALGDSVGIPGL